MGVPEGSGRKAFGTTRKNRTFPHEPGWLARAAGSPRSQAFTGNEEWKDGKNKKHLAAYLADSRVQYGIAKRSWTLVTSIVAFLGAAVVLGADNDKLEDFLLTTNLGALGALVGLLALLFLIRLSSLSNASTHLREAEQWAAYHELTLESKDPEE